jgi:hypothetical protein
MEAEADLVRLSFEEWRDLLAAAVELDLVHGGFFRARGEGIQFFAGPEDAPAGWSAPFGEGSPELPRALVGEAEVLERDGENGVTVRLRVSNWSAARAVKEAYDRGEYRGRFQQYVMAQEAALRGRPEDRAWLRRQVERLRDHAAGMLVRGV